MMTRTGRLRPIATFAAGVAALALVLSPAEAAMSSAAAKGVANGNGRVTAVHDTATDFSAGRRHHHHRHRRGNSGAAAAAAFAGIVGTIGAIAAAQARRDAYCCGPYGYYGGPYYASPYYGRPYYRRHYHYRGHGHVYRHGWHRHH